MILRKVYYYYDPIVKCDDGRYYVDFYCTNGKKTVWTGRHIEDSPTAVVEFVRELIDKLNQPKPLFGKYGRIYQWWWFWKRTRN